MKANENYVNYNIKLKIEPTRLYNTKRRNESGYALSKVDHIIAVSSCKGGVGKSTVALNLATSLQKLGAKVALLDADIYGPSLPTMIHLNDKTVRKSKEVQNFIEPLNYNDMAVMSFGFVNQKAAPGAGGKGAAIMRGPMVARVIDQLILGTNWGERDFLVIDMPPGTGDIHMSLAQQTAISTAVIVTTPQKLSFIDVEKGIEMFQNMKVPTSAVVQNMSYFDCEHGKRYYLFGKGHLKDLKEQIGINESFELPLLQAVSEKTDAGVPFILSHPDSELSMTYQRLAQTVVRSIIRQEYETQITPELLYDSKQKIMYLRIFRTNESEEYAITPHELRQHCRCASCVDEFTGKRLVDLSSIDKNVIPKSIFPKGNYAYAVVWSDGHASSLYTNDQLVDLFLHRSFKDNVSIETS